MVATSSQSLREILGISTTEENDTTQPYTAVTESVFAVDAAAREESTTTQETNHLRKSEKSMMDYFSEKLRLKKQKS